MSLLQALKLPAPSNFVAPGSGAAPPNIPVAPTGGPERQGGGKPGGKAGSATDGARGEATKLRGAIEAERRQAADLLLRMQKAEPLLKARVDAASGDEKKKLAAQQALLAKNMAEAEKSVKRAEADLEAIDNPGSKREELLAILARQKAGGRVAEVTEISATGLDPYKKGKINSDVTATTTSYADGKATTESVRSQQKVGLDGWTKTDSRDKAVTDGQVTRRASEETKTNVSLGGKLSNEQTKKVEVERADGSKAGVEVRKSQEVSSKGVSQSQTVKVSGFEGQSVAKTTSQGVERGDGQAVAKKGSSVTRTEKDGTATTVDKGANVGMVAGKDTIGAKAGVDGGKSMTTKGGKQAGVSLSLHANVSCKIGGPSGEPKLYPVTVTVSFGGSAGVSLGAGKKEGSKASGSVEVKGSAERSMVVTHLMKEDELGIYTQALEAASKGSKVAAAEKELAIIATGVKEGWDVARQMWESGGKSISKKTADGLVRSGDSAEVSETDTGGGAVKGEVMGVGAGYGVTKTKSRSTKVTRNDTGGLDVDAKQEEGKQTDLSMSMKVGVAGLEVGTTHVHKTRFGYSISIDRKNDPDGEILEALALCKTELQYEIFIGTHVGKITLIGRTKGKTDADGTNIGVSVGGAKLQLGTKQGVDQETTTDASGKVTGKKTTGTAGAGGALGKWADSEDDEAAAVTDAQGNSTLTLTTTKKKNYGDRVSDKKKKKLQEKLAGTGPQSGPLADLAGGEEDDTATQDVSGLTLANKDLRRIGKVAVNSLPAWMGMTRRWQENDDWKKAGLAIARAKGSPGVVAHALAEFIGGDRTERLKTVEQMVRGGYHQTGGKAFEFPDSLRDIRADYDLVSDDKLPDRMNTLANKQGDAAAAKECQRLLAIVDRIQPRVSACKDFSNLATKTEMLSELTKCRTMLNRGVEGFGGKLKPEDDPKVLAAEGERLLKLCNAYGVEQERLVAKMNDQDAVTVSERADGKKLIKQLEDLQNRWWGDFYRLQDNYGKRKLVIPQVPFYPGVAQIKPTESLVGMYEKKFVR